jgi:hypothetical protein
MIDENIFQLDVFQTEEYNGKKKKNSSMFD